MADTLRYNDIQQRSLHNAYWRQEQLLDQLIRHRIRCFELDLHAVGNGQGGHYGYPAEPNWFIYHTPGEHSNNIFTLHDALRLFRAFHDVNAWHGVVTLHLEPKAQEARTGAQSSTFARYTPDDLDYKLMSALGRENLFTPADLLAANPSAVSLFHAAGNSDVPGGPASGSWPTVDQLRGRFVIVVHGTELDNYASATNASSRVGFVMRNDVWWRPDEAIPRNRHVLFHDGPHGSVAKYVRDRWPGMILRSGEANNAGAFLDRQSQGCQLIMTDHVDIEEFPFVRTHNARLFPFGRAGFAGQAAWTHPDVIDRAESGTLHVLATYSGDLWDREDSFFFAHSPTTPPLFDVWTAAVATTSNENVNPWGKAVLMARSSLDASAAYFAVGRAADSHGLFIQYRSPGCGDPPNSSPCGTAQTRLGNRENVGEENIHFIRLEVEKQADGSTRCRGLWSIDGLGWDQIAQDVDLPLDLPHRGIAASSHGSTSFDGTPQLFVFQGLSRNGSALAGHPFVTLGIGDGVSATLTDYSHQSRIFVATKGSADGRILFNQAVLDQGFLPNWTELQGGALTDVAPSAMAIGNRIFVFIRATDGRILFNQAVLDQGFLPNWIEVQGGALTDVAPAATSIADRIFVFIKAIDGRILFNQAVLDQGFLPDWTELQGGALTDVAPAATSIADRIFVFIKATDGRILFNQEVVDQVLDQGFLPNWTEVQGGALTDVAPAATSIADRIFVFIKAIDGRILFNQEVLHAGFLPNWIEVQGGALTDVAPAAMSIADRIFVFIKAIDGRILFNQAVLDQGFLPTWIAVQGRGSTDVAPSAFAIV